MRQKYYIITTTLIYRFRLLTLGSIERMTTTMIKKDYDEYYRGIVSHKYTLDQVPLEDRTYELCYQAVLLEGLELKFVPFKHKTQAMKVAALNNNPGAIQYFYSG